MTPFELIDSIDIIIKKHLKDGEYVLAYHFANLKAETLLFNIAEDAMEGVLPDSQTIERTKRAREVSNNLYIKIST